MGFGASASGSYFNVNQRQIGVDYASPKNFDQYGPAKTSIEQTLNAGFGAASIGGDGAMGGGMGMGMNMAMGGAGGFDGMTMGGQLGRFGDAFQGMNVSPYGNQGMQMGAMGGMGMGNIAPFGAMQNPALAMAYQARYGGGQFNAGAMGSFRGGVGGAQFNMQAKTQLPVPNWLGKGAMESFNVGSDKNEFRQMTDSANRNISAKVQELMAAGADPEQIKLMVTQMRNDHIQQMLALMSTLNQAFNNMSKSIIQKISA